MSCLAVVVTFLAPIPARASGDGTTTQIGPVLTGEESSLVTVARDGGMGVPLPNGKDLWILGDTPTYKYQANGTWKLTSFIRGDTAGEGSYATGQTPLLDEVNLGKPLAAKNPAAALVPLPTQVYMPDGSGRLCTKANGAIEAAVRWATGATLLPDNTNVLITFVDVCVVSVTAFTVEGYGFMEYNWATNAISVNPFEVLPPATNGAGIPRSKWFGSPVVANNQVTFFSDDCCAPGHAYTTTMSPDLATLENPTSYNPQPVAGLPPSPFIITVAGGTPSLPSLWAFEWTDTTGHFAVYSAPAAQGPWSEQASGAMPGCSNSSRPCTTPHAHPELSTPSQLLVSYYMQGFGPGVPTHPDPNPPLNHLVMAAINVGAPAAPLAPFAVRTTSGAATTTGALKVTYKAGLNSGATIMGYTATCSSGDGGPTVTGSLSGAAVAPITVNGAAAGHSYSCSVQETNSHGTSPASVASAPVSVGAPGQPAKPGLVTVSPHTLKVSFTAPADNGSPITGYTASCSATNDTRSRNGTTSPIRISALAHKTYTCRVSATNARGTGPLSVASVAVKVKP